MRFRAITVVLGIGLGCGVWSSACSAPDPGAVTFVPRSTTVGTGSSSGAGTSSSGGVSSSSSSGGSSSGDGGSSSSGGTDAGKDTGVSAPNAFTGAPAYQQGTALQSSNQGGHNNQFNGTNNPDGQNCFNCHKNGGPSPAMVMGGGAVNATASIEVRVVDAKTGTQVADAYTDELGNFYVNGNPLNGTFAVGVRDGQKTSLMVGAITSGACNQGGTCHGGTQGPIKLQ